MNDILESKIMLRLINFSKKVHPGSHNFDSYDFQEILKKLISDYKILNLSEDQRFKVRRICHNLKDVRNFYAHRTLKSDEEEYKLFNLLRAKFNIEELEEIVQDTLTFEIISLINDEIVTTQAHFNSTLEKERDNKDPNLDVGGLNKDGIYAMLMVCEMMDGYCEIMDEIYGLPEDSTKSTILSEADLANDVDTQKIKNWLNSPHLSEPVNDEIENLKILVSVIHEFWQSANWVLPIIEEIQGQEQISSEDLVSDIVSNIQKQLHDSVALMDDTYYESIAETIDEKQARKQLVELREKILKTEKDIVREKGVLRKSLLAIPHNLL